MRVALVIGAATVLVGLAGPGGRAEEALPNAADLLFDEPQLAATRPGEVLDYSYERHSADAERLGPSFTDHLRLTIDQGSDPGTRTVEVEMFTGANRRPAGPFADMTGNPLLSLILEENIQSLAAKLGANPRYFKTAIRRALRETADVAKDTVRADGTARSGWRVTIMPFKDDPHRERMQGLDQLTYIFRVAKDLPGEIAAIEITLPASGAGEPKLSEKVEYASKSP